MSILKRFVKDTAVYGLATILPRIMSVVLVYLHTDKLETSGYAENTSFYIGAAFLNVLLTYGMETAFFRFFSKAEDKQRVYSTVLIALTTTTLIAFGLLWLLKTPITEALELPVQYFGYLLGVVILDALVVAPFAYLRAKGKALRFAGIKLINLAIYVILNVTLLWAIPYFELQFSWYSTSEYLIYIFFANLAASAVTFLLILPDFFKTELVFDKQLFGQLWRYGWPVLIAGLAFVVNENLDKLLLGNILDKDIMGAYSGCYKLAVFMTIFIQAFRLGAEPFFFNHASSKNAPVTYATILKYFTITGAFGLMIIVCFIDFFKDLLIGNSDYFIALEIVPYILLANLFLGIYHNLAVWYKLTDKTLYGMYFSLLGAALTIGLNWYFIPKIGFMASAYATVVAYGAMMGISYYFGQRHYRIPYNTLRIVLYLVLAMGGALLSFYLFRGNYAVSIVTLVLFAGITIAWEGRELKRILTKKSA
ncbi:MULTISPECIES: oligosaccharide flippase family protein [unclassified Leeuwenhoekiella]|uniref:oligosaccharide flippase family protein n=1 Tax=unclassified Leeuwenhoekiella TaxID=2615029 RepID=UPI000C6B6E93|nr:MULTISPECIES: oligosaccharide flippase family protein [unclassified Leeuwenhoekiella]MAW96039.1 polysaccharide biosynthesis protein [Leeuwenhoekiella sp.]MBA80033.1 polysaccharide biosynthesis protein [Leeuwenhoekiella sp.]